METSDRKTRRRPTKYISYGKNMRVCTYTHRSIHIQYNIIYIIYIDTGWADYILGEGQ